MEWLMLAKFWIGMFLNVGLAIFGIYAICNKAKWYWWWIVLWNIIAITIRLDI